MIQWNCTSKGIDDHEENILETVCLAADAALAVACGPVQLGQAQDPPLSPQESHRRDRATTVSDEQSNHGAHHHVALLILGSCGENERKLGPFWNCG